MHRLDGKTCTKCREFKSLSCFRNYRRSKDGLYMICKLCCSEKDKKWRSDNLEKAKTADKRWYKANPQRVRELSGKGSAKRRMTTKGKLSDNISTGIYLSIRKRKANCHWESLVNYTIDQLKRHLEKQFKPGLTWDNYGAGWHIDHKVPISAFNFEVAGDIDFARCWALKNLQPLEAKQNIRKGAKLNKPFQPSLAMAKL